MLSKEQRKEITKKVIDIINNNPADQAVCKLLEFHQQTSNQEASKIIQEPILYILQNQHDFNNLLKCLNTWEGHEEFFMEFYRRMKNRVSQPIDPSLTPQLKKQAIPELIIKYQQSKGNVQSLVQNIEKYLVALKQQQPTKPPETQMKKMSFPPQQINPQKPVQTKSEKAQSEKSLSISEPASKQHLHKLAEKKPTLGMMRKKDSNLTSSLSQRPTIARGTKRLTFGIPDQMKNNLKPQTAVQKQSQTHQGKVEKKPEEIFPKNQQSEQFEIKTGEPQHQKEEASKKNVFQKKEQIPIRVRPLFATEKKEGHQSQNQSQNETSVSKSLSRSLTPHKPLIERKKLTIKVANGVSAPIVEDNDDFLFESSQKRGPTRLFSDKKPPKMQIQNCEEEELRRELMNEKIPQKQESKESEPNKSEPRKQVVLKPVGPIKPKNVSMNTRRPNQLFSDYELSLLKLNLDSEEEDKHEVNIFKLQNKVRVGAISKLNEDITSKIEALKKERAILKNQKQTRI